MKSLNADFLKQNLKDFGYEIYHFKTVSSTMEIVEDFARSANIGSVIAIADHQTKGQGRKGRVWQDKNGQSLMFSMLFKIDQSDVASFADLVSLSICSTLKRIYEIPNIQIKYPNDIVIDNKKVGGILVKNIYDSENNYLSTNVGVGINTNYTNEDLSQFKADYPITSLSLHSDKKVNKQELLIELVKSLHYNSIELGIIKINHESRKNFEKKWRESSSMFGKQIAILKNDTIIEQGIVTDTGLGRGVELKAKNIKKWYSLYDSNMKARIIN